MLIDILNECVGLQLIKKDGDLYTLDPHLPLTARDPECGEANLPWTILELLFRLENSRHRELLYNFSWFLMQSVINPPKTWSEMESLLSKENVLDPFKINGSQYTQFQDWGVFLSLFITLPTKNKNAVHCYPNPTSLIERLLPELFKEKRTVLMTDLVDHVSRRIPILEQGEIWNEVMQMRDKPIDRYKLSTATSMAWLHLQDQDIVSFEYESDAPTYFLYEGTTEHRVTAITLH
ncbi:hypothetical protein H8B09_19710 [Paenibacillus sp. PR3]|uniref:Uncharacterized protein n=2 Tax=Paenibacillus terricola TaxID=2763503 RepID=A0ABR8MYH0_9BACL|nr:hypothetical protein [Paenibacillus terricola]